MSIGKLSRGSPFFQFQTDSFALFAVDTGVARRLGPSQMAWLSGALQSARGKAPCWLPLAALPARQRTLVHADTISGFPL